MKHAKPFLACNSAEQFHLALQVAPTAMLLVDQQGRITFANAQIEKLFGYTQNELLGAQIEQLVPARYLQQQPSCLNDYLSEYFDDCSAAAQAQNSSADQEIHGLHRDGSEIALDIQLTSVNAASGEFALCTVVNITPRRQSERQLLERTADLVASLKERDVLLQEIHHRVKNNLQVISSLINMQIRKLDASVASVASASREVLKECKTRIEVISLIHQKLYQSTNFANVQFADYARSLVGNVLHAGDASARIMPEFSFDNIILPVDKAIPCGLILNELLTNVVKHAYPGLGRGTVRITLQRLPENRLRLEVCDRGMGIANSNPDDAQGTIGLELISTLAEQLRGELQIVVNSGTCVRVDFPCDLQSRTGPAAE